MIPWARRLPARERDEIFERRILPDLMADATPSASPVAMIVAGQPGAGVPLASALLRRELTRTVGTLVHLSFDRLRAYHPGWRIDEESRAPPDAGWVHPEIQHWFDRMVQHVQRERLHLLVEDELRDARSIEKLSATLHRGPYVVQAVFVNTARDESALAVMARYALWPEHGMPPQFVQAQDHHLAHANVRAAMGMLEDRRAVDGLRIIDRHGAQIYENRLVDGEWTRTPRAQATLDVERDRARPPKEMVRFAMRWESLVPRLVHDPAVPREVAGQALALRNELVARCEAVPAAAQMLQWAREAAAFRAMDRFEFEREFPHHARAVKSLGLAFIEAEKYTDAEGARLLFHARENIAQRIERGDMARIAAREKKEEPPTR